MEEQKKIKVLWVSNVPPIPIYSNNSTFGGGWLAGAYESIKGVKAIELSMAFPVISKTGIIEGSFESVNYYGFSLPRILKVIKIRPIESVFLRKYLSKIIKKSSPDILHIFGTEFLQTRVAVESFHNPDKTIIHIQGLVSVYSKHCLLNFPFLIRHLFVPSSIVRSTIYGKSRKFYKAGKDEIKAIQQVSNVMGRTEWDEACTKQINSSVNYIHCGETLRQSFYDESSQWKYEKCRKHSIYFSQSSSQVKGLHLVLPILSELILRYPDVHLYIGGNSPIGSNDLFGMIRRSPLGWYIKHQIKKYKLENYVTFLGVQNEQQVVQNLKNAHVFLSASLIENSPNSIGEALLVGTPVVSSDVGGVKDFIKHGENGFIYPVDEPYMLNYYIGILFDNIEIAKRISINGSISSLSSYSSDKNMDVIISTYNNLQSPN